MNQRSITTSNGSNGNTSNAQTNLQQDTNCDDIYQQPSVNSHGENAEYREEINKTHSNTKIQAMHHQQHHHSTSPSPSPPVSLSDRNHESTSSHWMIKNPTDRTNSKRKAKSDNNDPSSNRPQASFINKLYKMLEDESIQHLINWSENGDLFSVGNPTAFSKLVLPQYFKHNNWQSFVRQLNMYGFHKVNDMIHSNLTSENQKWEFKHQHFRRGAVNDLQNIKRKSAKSHHQYLSPSIVGSSISTSSMGRLILGRYPHQKTGDDSYRRNEKLILIKSNNSDSGAVNGDQQWHKSLSEKDYQSDPLYQHVLQMENRIHQLSQSHDDLKNETDQLRAILTSRNSAMEEVMDLLHALTKDDPHNVNLETVASIKQNMTGLQESITNDKRYNKRPSVMSIISSRSSSTSPYMSNSDNDYNTSESRRSSIIRYSTNGTQYNDQTSNSKNKQCGNDMATYRNDEARPEGMPISSILSGSPPKKHHQYEEPEKTRNQRLPSIDIVCTEPPSPHHHLHLRSQELQSNQSFSSPPLSSVSSNSLSPSSKSLCISSNIDIDQPIPPLRPLRSLLEANDLVRSQQESKNEPRSAYMRLGKESPLLNPPLQLQPPPYDYSGSNDAKRRRSDHDYTHVP